MKYIFIVSRNSCFNYLDSRTLYHQKQGQWKVRTTLLKSKSCFWNYNTFLMILYNTYFDTHLTATLTISSKKDNKYEVVFLNWSLAIVITEPVPFRIVSKWYGSCIFTFAIFWLKELRLVWMGKNDQTKTTYSFKVHSQSVQETTISNIEHKLLWYASSLTMQSFWKNFYLALLKMCIF